MNGCRGYASGINCVGLCSMCTRGNEAIYRRYSIKVIEDSSKGESLSDKAELRIIRYRRRQLYDWGVRIHNASIYFVVTRVSFGGLVTCLVFQ